jgi:hypothetical protein
MKLRLPKLDSATWKALITALQTFAAFLVAFATVPEAMDLLTKFYPVVVPLVISGAGIASFILNFFRKDVKNY